MYRTHRRAALDTIDNKKLLINYTTQILVLVYKQHKLKYKQNRDAKN